MGHTASRRAPADACKRDPARYRLGMTDLLTDPDASLPTLDDIAALGRAAFAELPEPFRGLCRDLVIMVQDLPEPEICAEFELDSPLDLLGLYSGTDLTRASVLDVRQDLDRIYLYRLPLLNALHFGRDTLAELVNHVLIHEIGHHFGLSDEDMERIEGDRF